MVGVNLSEPPERVRAYAASMELTFPIVIDQDGDVTRAYGVRFTPTHILVDRAGVVRAGGAGGKDWNSPAAHAVIGRLLEAASSEPSGSVARPDQARSPQPGSHGRR